MLPEVWISGLVSVFSWWFSTGVIMVAVRWADRAGGQAHAMLAIMTLPVLALGVAGVVSSLPRFTTGGVYTGFFATLAIWGWIEITFLTGIASGPERSACPVGLSGGPRFLRAARTVIHHEALLLGGLAFLVIATRGAPNAIALWTYGVLFLARILAKLNLFFGVPRINVEFVPQPLRHLASYFRQSPATAMFPVSLALLGAVFCLVLLQLVAAEIPAARAAFSLLAALTLLALLELALMVVPLPDAKLWRWMLPAPSASTPKKGSRHGV